MKLFGKNQVQEKQCKFVEYRPNGIINSIKKFLGRSYETEKDPTCRYLYSRTEALGKELYLCPHQGNLAECKKIRTLDKKLEEYKDLKRKIESCKPLGILDAVDRMSQIPPKNLEEILLFDESIDTKETVEDRTNVGPNVTLVKFEYRKVEHEPYRDDEGEMK